MQILFLRGNDRLREVMNLFRFFEDLIQRFSVPGIMRILGRRLSSIAYCNRDSTGIV